MLRYLTDKMDGSAAASSTDRGLSAYETPKPKTRRMWACDVCQAKFPDYEEACIHEEKCRAHQETKAMTADSNAIATKRQNFESSTSKAISPVQWSCHVCQKPFADFDAASRHENKCRGQQEASEKAATASKPVHPFFAKGTQKEEKKQKAKQDAITIDSSPPVSDQDSEKPRKRKAPKTQTEAITKKAKATKQKGTNKKTNVPIADIFATRGGTSQIMAEHRAAEFLAKRKADAERERERQRRRQENRQQKMSESNKAMDALVRTKAIIPAEVRFPVPSHVTVVTSIPDVDELPDASRFWIDQDSLVEAQWCLSKTLRHADTHKTSADSADCTALLPFPDRPIATIRDPIEQALSALLTPPERTISKSSAEAWCDKYSIQKVPKDVCGKHNKETARELLKFVDEWKVERGRAHQRRAEKQRALLKSKKKKKRRYKEDDIWEDSDDEEGGLCNVCLLTGPSGSGKTDLVHAVARQSECTVLEINTTERRGGAALKNVIAEATQSDSLQMMHQKTQITADEEPLQDSDDDEEASTKAAPLILVLVDEVDIMYEDEGDAGFWPALSALTKKAKCPIFLTANIVPDALISSNMRYIHLETSRPKPDECVTKMRRILRSEGLKRTPRFSDGSASNKQLSLIAQLCKCDLRRVINELQLFATAPPPPPSATMMDTSECSAETTSSEATLFSFCPPQITGVSPKEVSPYEFSLLTIKGEHFTAFAGSHCPETELSVSIGNQLSPAVKVLDDTTILAVCPPCSLAPGIEDTGMIAQTGRESKTSRFASLSIQLHARGRFIARSDAGVTTTAELCDGTPNTSLARQHNIEYAFPPSRYNMLDDDPIDSDEDSVEAKSGWNDKPKPAINSTPTDAVTDRTEEEIVVLLEKGLREWKASHPESKNTGDTESVCHRAFTPDEDGSRRLNKLSSLTKLSSDASLLEDGFEFGGVPFLAGVVPGFGASLVNDVVGNNINCKVNEKKLLRDANARPPTFERLFSLGWNDDGYFFGNNDAYMNFPGSAYEKELLSRSERLDRGLPRALSVGTSSSDSYQDDVHEEANAPESLAESIKLHEAPRHLSEESLFVRPPELPSIHSLPDELRRHVMEAGHNLIDPIEMDRLPIAAKDKAYELTRLLSHFLKEDTDPSANRLLLGVSRLSAPTTIVPLANRMEPSIFLDYLPMLCNMSLHERASEYAFQQVLQADPESAAAMSRRGLGRTTRRSGKTLERRHYFVKTRNCTDDSEANALGLEFAKEVLQYSPK